MNGEVSPSRRNEMSRRNYDAFWKKIKRRMKKRRRRRRRRVSEMSERYDVSLVER